MKRSASSPGGVALVTGPSTFTCWSWVRAHCVSWCPSSCDLHVASAISIGTTVAHKNTGLGGVCERVQSTAKQHSQAALPSHTPGPPLHCEAHTQRSLERGSTIRKHLWIPCRTPPWLHSILSSFIKGSICSSSDPGAWTNGWRPAVAPLPLAVFPAPINHQALPDRPSPLLLLILWLFQWLL